MVSPACCNLPKAGCGSLTSVLSQPTLRSWSPVAQHRGRSCTPPPTSRSDACADLDSSGQSSRILFTPPSRALGQQVVPCTPAQVVERPRDLWSCPSFAPVSPEKPRGRRQQLAGPTPSRTTRLNVLSLGEQLAAAKYEAEHQELLSRIQLLEGQKFELERERDEQQILVAEQQQEIEQLKQKAGMAQARWLHRCVTLEAKCRDKQTQLQEQIARVAQLQEQVETLKRERERVGEMMSDEGLELRNRIEGLVAERGRLRSELADALTLAVQFMEASSGSVKDSVQEQLKSLLSRQRACERLREEEKSRQHGLRRSASGGQLLPTIHELTMLADRESALRLVLSPRDLNRKVEVLSPRALSGVAASGGVPSMSMSRSYSFGKVLSVDESEGKSFRHENRPPFEIVG
eukprot:gnl/TRDRNA2_/TRDRNA2_46495_c0_seq1.p1 gnl/TRDRNA2_/TRDRNA2_46495_c0~~gnl/TRDRNA2_/TRDRNA2_46495_c0_seq1.p1  ORF type:complete len:405 (+),score=88.88 gnl/TRDRNA2_/TRDRNA2_46495_c0_seq1:20-1234(+)